LAALNLVRVAHVALWLAGSHGRLRAEPQYRAAAAQSCCIETCEMNKGFPDYLRPWALLLFLASNLLGGQVCAQTVRLPSAPEPAACISCGAAVAPFASQQPVGGGQAARPGAAAQKKEKKEESSVAQEPVKKKNEQKENTRYSPTASTGSPGHIFWVFPAFKVNYSDKFEPLTPDEKFQQWLQGIDDPLGLGVGAVQAATLEYSSSDGFCGYGTGAAGYGKCFGSLELDATDSSFLGDYVFTVLLHQDPRYFRLGRGSVAKRGLYAISRVFVTHSDSGRNVFYTSALSGTVIAACISNLYYPQHDRGVGLTVSRIGIDLGNTALYNGAAEFWPGIHHWFDSHF
jgi:hypothetical protein